LHGAPYYQVHRADIHGLLAARVLELKRDAIRLNCRVVGFEETADGIKLRLADGTTVQGDLLVGADGLKSVICQQTFGNVPATYTGDAAWRITVPVERLPQDFMEQVMMVWMGPGRHVVAYYLRAGAMRRFLADLHGIGVEEFADHLYEYYEERAVRHLFAVASGIDSMVVGEAQILGQVREAFQAAQAERTAGPLLSALFAQAIKVGRRARRETGIGDGLASTTNGSAHLWAIGN